jgi:hypothetical protein
MARSPSNDALAGSSVAGRRDGAHRRPLAEGNGVQSTIWADADKQGVAEWQFSDPIRHVGLARRDQWRVGRSATRAFAWGQVLPSSDDQITGGLRASVVPTLMVQSVKFESLPFQKSWVALTMKVLKSDVRAIKPGAIRTEEGH